MRFIKYKKLFQKSHKLPITKINNKRIYYNNQITCHQYSEFKPLEQINYIYNLI